MADSERLSRPPATTSYSSTYYPLGVERLFSRQLQPPKVSGPQALPRTAARPEHRTLMSAPPRAWRVLPGAEGPHWGAGGGGRTRGCLAPLWSKCCSHACLISTGDRRHARCAARGGVGRWAGGGGGSEGRAAALAPVAAPVGGCECRENCCSCTPVHRMDPCTPLTYPPYRRRQLRPSSRSARDLSKSARARMPLTSSTLPENAGEVSIGISNWK